MSANGRLKFWELATVDGVRLGRATAKAWLVMVGAARGDGIVLSIVRPAGGYRSYFVQGDMHAHPSRYNLNPASSVNLASPGSSTHGTGESVDIAGLVGARRGWVLANAARFGFSRPFGEADPNHFHYSGLVLAGAGKAVVESSMQEEEVMNIFVPTGGTYDGKACLQIGDKLHLAISGKEFEDWKSIGVPVHKPSAESFGRISRRLTVVAR